MNKNILVPDIYSTLATIAISLKSKPSTASLVLADIISLSENGIILHPKTLQPTICQSLNLSPENYRAAITKLTKMNLIVRKNGIILLHPLITTPFTKITISQI